MDPKLLSQKLPEVRHWINRLLAEHASEGKPVAAFGFERLPRFYSTQLLLSTKVVAVPHVPVPPLASLGLPELSELEKSDASGITYFNTYFVRDTEVSRESLHFHELVHVIQWQHLGVDNFLTSYATGLLENGYRENPLEVMAYELEAYFNQGHLPPIDIETVVRSQL